MIVLKQSSTEYVGPKGLLGLKLRLKVDAVGKFMDINFKQIKYDGNWRR